ncbi:hypothetical protein M9Y10_040117 [Tritrichomonas musculus]|uniref:HAT C-terminal dimerisation domain-containing protein n=1 Tax=Tritrichomonas musculus TaxID=1915356 RepID=A0ABR2GRQ1_9EUKA
MSGCLKLSRNKKINHRNIHFAKCSQCGEFFSNHRSYYNHKKICKKTLVNQKCILNFTPEKVEEKQRDVTAFQKKLIEMIIGTNMSFSQVEKPYFIELFTFLGVKETEIPTQYILRKSIINYSEKIYRTNFSLLENETCSLVVDGSTSWSNTYYELAIYKPGMIKHYKLMRIGLSTAQHLSSIIKKTIQNLRDKNISIVGICTDNGPNLKAACDQIQTEFLNGTCEFPLIRFACCAHTAQLIIKDLYHTGTFFGKIAAQSRKLVIWLKKQEIRNYSQKFNLNSPPTFSEIRWNSIYFCIDYIYQNYYSINDIIEKFKYTKSDLKDDLNDINDYREIIQILEPINIFTCKVESNFATVGDSFKELLKLKEAISNIKNSKNQLHKIVLKKISDRFEDTCDSDVAELAYILTDEGRQWWNQKAKKSNLIIRKLTDLQNIDEHEQKYLTDFLDEKERIKKKIENLSDSLKLNRYNAVCAFYAFLNIDSSMYENPIQYWKDQTGSVWIYDKKPIAVLDSSRIAIRILTLPCSEALCERMFSQLKYVHNARRNCLKEDILDSIINIRFEMNIKSIDVSFEEYDEEY